MNWGRVAKQFEEEMSDKLDGLPGHQEVPENLREFRSIVSHELPETSSKELYRKLIKLLLKNKTAGANKIRERHLKPELEREQQIISTKKEELEKLKQSARVWVRMWKTHQSWLPRRYTTYRNPDLPFQQIAADTLGRAGLL